MDECKTDDEAESASPRWAGAPSIPLAHQLNGQCIELVCELANNLAAQDLPPFILENRDLWRLLEPEALKCVAALPFVIVDLRFKDAEAWLQASGGHTMSAGAPRYSGFPTRLFEDFVLDTLLFARQAAREDVTVAKVMFAMTPAVVRVIAALTVSQIRVIAHHNARELRVRWDNDSEFWRDLLMACRSDDEVALASIRQQAKVLFSGEFISSLGR